MNFITTAKLTIKSQNIIIFHVHSRGLWWIYIYILQFEKLPNKKLSGNFIQNVSLNCLRLSQVSKQKLKQKCNVNR